MTNKLYLLRHAKTEPWSPLGNDFSRSLTSAGTYHAKLVSDWAQKMLTPPDTILCSPAKRARETLAPLLGNWPQLLATTDYVDSMYNATLTMLLTLAGDAFSYSERLLMVGHNPGLEQMLINVLQQEQAVTIQHMSAGTLSVIEFPGGFSRVTNKGRLLHLISRENISDN